MFCDRWPNFLGNAQEHVYDFWITLSSGALADRFAGGLERRSTPVWPVGCDGIKSIGYAEDSRSEKNLFSLKAVRIAPSAVLLVVHEKDFGGIRKKGDILDDVEPDLYMLLHKLPLVHGERSWL